MASFLHFVICSLNYKYELKSFSEYNRDVVQKFDGIYQKITGEFPEISIIVRKVLMHQVCKMALFHKVTWSGYN